MPELTYSSSMQNDIALLVSKSLYANLSTEQKTMIDGESLGSPTGAVGRALSLLGEYANKLNLGAPDEIPSIWEHWLVKKAAADCAASFSVAEDEDLTRAAFTAQVEAFQAYSMLASDHTTADDLGYEVQKIRRYVFTSTTSGDKPVLPQVSLIDTAIESVLSELWNMADWSFRSQDIVVNLAANGTVTYTPAVTVTKFLSPILFYTDVNGGQCVLADDEMINEWRSENDLDTGKPEYFRTSKTGSTVSLVFNRDPDDAYTMRTSVAVGTPAMASIDNLNTMLGLITNEFKPIIRDWVLGKVLARMSQRESTAILRQVHDQMDSMLYTMNASESEEKQDSYRSGRRQSLGGPSFGDSGGFV